MEYSTTPYTRSMQTPWVPQRKRRFPWLLVVLLVLVAGGAAGGAYLWQSGALAGGDEHEGWYQYRSEDGGESWTRVSAQNGRPMYYSEIFIDPNDPNVVYTLATESHVSRDGGRTWTQIAEASAALFGRREVRNQRVARRAAHTLAEAVHEMGCNDEEGADRQRENRLRRGGEAIADQRRQLKVDEHAGKDEEGQ